MSTVLLITLSLVLPAQPAVEGEPIEQRIRVLDAQEIWDNWIEYQRMVAELDAMQRLDQTDIESLQNGLQERIERLKSDLEKRVVSQRDFDVAQQVLAREARDISGYARIRERIVQSRIEVSQENRKRMIRQTLLEYKDQKSIGIVIKSTEVAFRSPQLEISDDLVEVLNRGDRVRIEQELRDLQNDLRSGRLGRLPGRTESSGGFAPFDPGVQGN